MRVAHALMCAVFAGNSYLCLTRSVGAEAVMIAGMTGVTTAEMTGNPHPKPTLFSVLYYNPPPSLTLPPPSTEETTGGGADRRRVAAALHLADTRLVAPLEETPGTLDVMARALLLCLRGFNSYGSRPSSPRAFPIPAIFSSDPTLTPQPFSKTHVSAQTSNPNPRNPRIQSKIVLFAKATSSNDLFDNTK